ncbi:TetR/AcrR family transcriptional regulator [Granulosicoccus antarcticus]|uniref:HTH-type transcriptional repressor ComR n=1 Tax=Granulosicoccus antarcticus IMCC3135 TaxID=1192854 RepID=A0A2Z2NRN4_9GAMM|nr:TetR/AcrR family transcriptional regulator [Granulosicoccus antarcticus]ASJ70197.1 HTH-type transcriptional repressor ComR [Granulosicoccus antarcticus IMCC3135]
MPWEKSFDEEVAVSKAMDVFWQKGFEPASIADLIAETGITRGSLYNAFGGKEQLFIRALQKYDQEYRCAMLTELEALDDPMLTLRKFFDGIVADTLADPLKKGCFLINTSSDLAIHGEAVNQIVRDGLRELESFFSRNIKQAQARKELPLSLDPEASAKGLLSMVVAIRVLGRGMLDAAALNTLAAQAMRLLH